MTGKPAGVEAWLTALGGPQADRDYRPGHARMRALLKACRRQRPLLRIRIAGTNGKGSTAHMLANALAASGYTVGLYTSPHVQRFNERIRIHGGMLTDAALLAGLERLLPAARAVGASYFEVATALALDAFATANVEVEILEAGVGAKLDATTSVPADMALMTPIALDHQAWLGRTMAAIAADKAFAMNGCRFALSAAQAPAARRTLLAARPDIRFVRRRRWPGLAAVGEHQRMNASLALAACTCLNQAGFALDLQQARRAIAATHVPGRLQHVAWGGKHLWLDAGHNLHAVRALLPTLPQLADPFDAILVFTRADRDLSAAMPLLRPYTRRLIGAVGDCDAVYADVAAALAHELAGGNGERFLVLGSFTTVAAALDWLGRRGAVTQ